MDLSVLLRSFRLATPAIDAGVVCSTSRCPGVAHLHHSGLNQIDALLACHLVMCDEFSLEGLMSHFFHVNGRRSRNLPVPTGLSTAIFWFLLRKALEPL